MEHKREKMNSRVIHALIGVAIMIGFRYLPLHLEHVSSIGMQVLGIFIGTLYLWTTTDPLWSSLLCIVMLGVSDYATMNQVLASFLGNPIVVQMFFIMVLMEALVYSKLTLYISRFFLTRRWIQGRPWLFTLTIILGAYVIGVFISPFTPILLFWPVMYDVFEQAGYNRMDEYPAISLILIVLASVAGFPVAPYMGNALALLSNYRTISGNIVISDGLYFLSSFLLGILMLVIMLLIAKYLFHPDVEKLKNLETGRLGDDELPPLSKSQKLLGAAFLLYIVVMILPTLLPEIPGMSFLAQNSYGWSLAIIAVCGGIHIEGKPLIEFSEVMKHGFAWPVFLLCGTAILLGGVLTNDVTGISVWLNSVLLPVFQTMTFSMFLCIFLIVTVVLTNLCNSLVIGMMLEPVVLAYCTATGINPAPIITLLIFTVLSMAVMTPAASPFAALLFGNKEWLSSGAVYKYALPTIVVEVLCLLGICIPVSRIIF